MADSSSGIGSAAPSGPRAWAISAAGESSDEACDGIEVARKRAWADMAAQQSDSASDAQEYIVRSAWGRHAQEGPPSDDGDEGPQLVQDVVVAPVPIVAPPVDAVAVPVPVVAAELSVSGLRRRLRVLGGPGNPASVIDGLGMLLKLVDRSGLKTRESIRKEASTFLTKQRPISTSTAKVSTTSMARQSIAATDITAAATFLALFGQELSSLIESFLADLLACEDVVILSATERSRYDETPMYCKVTTAVSQHGVGPAVAGVLSTMTFPVSSGVAEISKEPCPAKLFQSECSIMIHYRRQDKYYCLGIPIPTPHPIIAAHNWRVRASSSSGAHSRCAKLPSPRRSSEATCGHDGPRRRDA